MAMCVLLWHEVRVPHHPLSPLGLVYCDCPELAAANKSVRAPHAHDHIPFVYRFEYRF
jgi:hypothetical protein